MKAIVFVLLAALSFEAQSGVIQKSPPSKKTAERKVADDLPFVADDSISYMAANSDNMLGFARSEEFIGVLQRPYARTPQLQQIYLYGFGEKTNPLTRRSCEAFVQKMVGSFEGSMLKKTRSETFQSSNGQGCLVTMEDPDATSISRERHIYITGVGRQVYALMFQYRVSPTKAESLEMLEFVKSLKEPNQPH
ncbi:MAG: hypothetical protein KF681_07040 [Bdellovibrionaceae bacterium]|nr:hypothetical protein [Pseudobdellovibrionaceae bacterium]